MRNRIRAGILAALLTTTAVGATAQPAAADVSSYCGHDTAWTGLWSTRFSYEYQRPSQSFPFIETVHVYSIFRKGGQRGTEWIWKGTESRVCHRP
jgi:hypothetical protein